MAVPQVRAEVDRGSVVLYLLRVLIRAVLAMRAVSVVFFFQAEDGIRDYKVTGVQTCALPISGTARRGQARRPRCNSCRRARWYAPRSPGSPRRRAPRAPVRRAQPGRPPSARDRKSVV